MPPLPRILPFGEFPLVLDAPFTLQARYLSLSIYADAVRMSKLVHSTFDWAASHVKVTPSVTPDGTVAVILVFSDYSFARASGPGGATGASQYKELSVFVPVTVETGSTTWPALHLPYLYLDDTLAIAAGQEIYGLPKKPAALGIPAWSAFAGGAPLTIDVRAIQTAGQDFAPHNLLTITASPSHATPHAAPAPTLAERRESLIATLSLPIVQLKQIPSADGVSSIYRSVVRTPSPLTGATVDHALWPPKVQLGITPLLTDPMADVLGPGGELSVLGLGGTMNLTLGAGEALYEEFAGPSKVMSRM